MSLKTESSYVDESIGIKVEGELGDFQIVEEVSDSDDVDSNNYNSSRTIDTLPSIASSLVKPADSPVCGNIAVSNSENVIIGNNTYFNGPVTIKQVIQNAPGIDNPSYCKTEDEDTSEGQPSEGLKKERSIKKFQLHSWHKVAFSAVCIITLGGIFAILSIILSSNSQDDSSSSKLGEEDPPGVTNFTTVVGMCYKNINLLIITVILMPVTCLLMFYTILTLDGSGNDKSGQVVVKQNNRSMRDYDAIEDDCHTCSCRPVKKDNPLLIAPDHLRIVPRGDWLAQPVEKELNRIRQPVPWVIISHTATENCSSQSECILRVRLIQMFHIESRNWDDIAYNFLVAGDGSAYYGRGWDYVGSHTLGYNKYSIGISFIGTFNNDPPPKKQLDACIKLLKRGVEIGKLAKDYKLFIHRQLASTLSPGDKLCDIIKEWPHFVKSFTDISELLPNY